MNFTRKTYQELIRAYNQAVQEKKKEFQFHQETILTDYAKYLIEYLKDLK